jgi:hypothetical protein
MKRITFGILMAALVFWGTTWGAMAAPPLANAVILIIRHAEKPLSGPGLTLAGQQRAEDYVSFFKNYQIDSHPLHLDHLIAAADSKRSERPRLTLLPLSAALHLPIDTRFHSKDISALTKALQSKPNGKIILICWHHEEIPDILRSLGADPTALLPNGSWPNNVYNWVIVLRYDKNGHLLATEAQHISEHLLP